MNKLVVHHIYANGMAFDLSGFRNHGAPYAIADAPPPLAPAFAFATGDSRVVVQQSGSLQDLLAVRAVVTFNLNPSGGLVRRYNLIEGHVSFALFVNPDGSLTGTIVDADGLWLGAQSPANLVVPGQWHTAELRHDGVNQCVLLLDGVAVASAYAAAGPVRSVGPHGIAIGHWPEVSGQYTFEGVIREVWVYKYDPAAAAQGLLDTCCGDYRSALDSTAETLRSMGYTKEKARAQGLELMKFGLATAARVRGTDPVRSKQQATLSAQALAAFQRGDSAAYTTAFTQLAEMAATTLAPADQQQIHAEMEQLVKALPLPIKHWQALIGKMCWGKAKIDPKMVYHSVEQMLAKKTPKSAKAGRN